MVAVVTTNFVNEKTPPTNSRDLPDSLVTPCRLEWLTSITDELSSLSCQCTVLLSVFFCITLYSFSLFEWCGVVGWVVVRMAPGEYPMDDLDDLGAFGAAKG